MTGLNGEQYGGIVWAGSRRTDLPLLEREAEQAQLKDVVASLGEGRPAVVSVTGRPGFGHNALLRWTARLAEERSVRVLRASGSLTERDLRHGAVIQLLSPLGEVAERPLRVLREHHEPDGLPGLLELLHTVRRTPTLVTVEDAQWLDPASLHWLQALVRRLSTGLPLALLIGRTGVDPHGPDWLADTAPSAQLTRHLTVRGLSPRAVATLAEMIFGVACDETFAAAAVQAAHGNPAVLHAALHCLADAGHRPTAALVPQLRTVITGIIGDRAGRALRGLTDESTAVLRALAVAGDLLDFTLICNLAGLRSVRETRLRSALETAGFTVPDGACERIRLPVVRARILEDTPAAERGRLYAGAARLAYRAGAPDEDIAGLLLHAPPIGESWAVHALQGGFDAAVRRSDDITRSLPHAPSGGEPWGVHALRGSFGTAVRRSEFARAAACLNRALDEPQHPVRRAEISLDLASAEAASAPVASDRRLAAVVNSPGEGELWSHVRLQALDMGLARGDDSWGRRVATQALASAQGSERDDLIALYWYAAQSRPEATDISTNGVPALPEHPLAPAQAGIRAAQLTARGQHREQAAQLARRALEAGPAAPVMPRLEAARALWLTDAAGEAEEHLDAIVAELGRHHRRPALARALALSAGLHLRGGRLDAAEHAADAAERVLPAAAWHPLAAPYLLAIRSIIAVETHQHDVARALTGAPIPPGAESSVHWPLLLHARARVAADEGRWAEAVELFKEGGRWLLRRQWVNPAVLPWRSLAARVLITLGDREQARRLIDEELTLARRWGAPSAVGLAHLCAGSLDAPGPAAGSGGSTGIARWPNQLAYAWGLADLATEEATKGDHTIAARLLTELSGHRVTRTSSRLAERARWLATRLEQTATPNEFTSSKEWAALTPAERQTAELAGRGLGNREIAEQLSVSRRTVELRLSSTYKKLGITSREELLARSRPTERT
ncbi:AAA family ATPase [Streptomyces noursei]|uniref:AAA family ATPase n=1 Tax=Streptomyces noursei TaxID=1971 RepID=UPI001F04B61D|nr:LuxR family transcriptional regulator [Streptomyces noursei]